MLSMFPRFALVVVRTYFIVLAKVFRPSSIPRRITSRFRSSNTKSAASRATSTACVDRQARVGRMHGRRIVDAVAKKPNDMAHLFQCEDDAFLLIGIDLHEQIRSLGGVPECFLVQREHLASGEHAVVRQSNQRGDVLGYALAVAGNQLHRDAESAERVDGVGCAWLRTVEKREESHELRLNPFAGRGRRARGEHKD